MVPFVVQEDRAILILVTDNKEFLTLADIMCWVTKTRGVCEINLKHHVVNQKLQVRVGGLVHIRFKFILWYRTSTSECWGPFGWQAEFWATTIGGCYWKSSSCGLSLQPGPERDSLWFCAQDFGCWRGLAIHESHAIWRGLQRSLPPDSKIQSCNYCMGGGGLEHTFQVKLMG